MASTSIDRFHHLSRHGQDVDNLSWSADHRMAVTTPEMIIVCTLLRSPPTPSTPSHKPLMMVSTAHALTPHTKELPRPVTVTQHLDPAFATPTLSYDPFKRSDWSPLGCNQHRGCVLCGLTASGRLALYTPPTSQWKLWKHVLTISDILLDAEIAVTMTPHDKAMFSFCTAFSWLPCMLSGRVIIAMATRSGHLVLVEMSLPVTGSISDGVKVVWAELLTDCGEGREWACSLKWCHTQDPCVSVGCTDGRVMCLQWMDADFTSANIKSIWTNDTVPVYHMTYLPQHIVFAKGSMLIVCPLEEGNPPANKGNPLTVCGVHSLPISGLVATNQNAVLSSSLDGSVQMWRVGDTRPHPLRTGITGHTLLAAHGLALSHNALLLAVTINERFNQEKKQGCSLYFLNIADDTVVTRPLPTVMSPWDIVEILRQMPTHSGYLELLLDHAHKNDSRLSALLTLQEAIINQQSGDELVVARQRVVCAHAQWCLGEVEEGAMDAVSTLSAGLMISWLKAYGVNTQLYSRVYEGPTTNQECPVCDDHVTLHDNLLTYHCPSGHSWDVCPLTMVLVSGCSECSVCVQCGGVVNSPSSLHTQPGSWLHKVLTQQNQCTYCGGYFEAMC